MAKDLIIKGMVLVDGSTILKPSYMVDDSNIEILKETLFVSRAGDKLDGFLKKSSIDITDLDCLDIGSSTGGFVQVLLKYGVKSIVAVDVGSNQLHSSLRGNPLITLKENMDIRKFKSDKKFNLITCDVSFISTRSILKDIDRLSLDHIIILFKPQFEVGRDIKRDKRGVVKDQKAINSAKDIFKSSCCDLGWRLIQERDSTIAGREGNIEIFYYFKK
jgi:23S rRNA (cytidine1920-2'-O)/16S rRNA (cytidine1409-2'-O)-methyltransferase